MAKTEIVAIRLNPHAVSVLRTEAERAKRSVSDLVRIVVEEKFPRMVEKARKRA